MVYFILVIAVLCAAPVNSLVKGIRSRMTEGSKGLAVLRNNKKCIYTGITFMVHDPTFWKCI